MNAQLNLTPYFHTLSNGMRLVFFPQPHLHSAGIGLYIKVGSRLEEKKLLGVSHFLEHILFRGNTHYPTSLEMNRAFESWGGSINGFTTREYTYFFGQLHPAHLVDAVPFMREFFRQPLFAGIELERKIILEERLEDVDENGQDLDVDDISRQGLWGDNPLARKIIGTPHSINNIQEQDLRNHFENFYHAENVVLCFTGAFQIDQILPLVENAFSDFPTRPHAQHNFTPPPPQPLQSTAFVKHDSSQISLQLSFIAPPPDDPDIFAALLLERILDDGMSSRLWQRIVEEKGLCYEIWSSLDVYHDIALLDISANVAPERVIPLVESIYEELDELREKGPSPDEFELARRRWSFRQEYLLDKVESLNEQLGVATLFDLYIPFDEQQRLMQAITPQSFINISRSILQHEQSLLAAVGPLSKSTKRSLKSLLLSF